MYLGTEKEKYYREEVDGVSAEFIGTLYPEGIFFVEVFEGLVFVSSAANDL